MCAAGHRGSRSRFATTHLQYALRTASADHEFGGGPVRAGNRVVRSLTSVPSLARHQARVLVAPSADQPLPDLRFAPDYARSAGRGRDPEWAAVRSASRSSWVGGRVGLGQNLLDNFGQVGFAQPELGQ